MIDTHRFVASKNVSAERWLAARREGVTATQVAKAAATNDGGFAIMLPCSIYQY